MTLRTVKTKIEAAELLGIDRDTFSDRSKAGVYAWPPISNAKLVAEHVAFEKGGRVINSDDARFRRARAQVHELEAAKELGTVAPIEMFEEQIVSVFGLFVQESEGVEARLRRKAGALSDAIRSEFRALRGNLARGVERFCEGLEERAIRSAPSAGAPRRRVGGSRKDTAGGERRARAV